MGEVFTIPPDVPFLDALARGLLAEVGDDDLAASDTIVLLPTRRACRNLRDAFLKVGGGQALLLPRMQPIGDVDADELIVDAEVDVEVPRAIGRTRRLLLLARLLEAHEAHAPIEHRLRLAGELAALLDELASERKSLRALENVVPEHLAEHFQITRRLLTLIERSWPRILRDEGALDPAERRNRVLDGFALRLRSISPDRRIVVAGTTGSIDATRRLLGAVKDLPRGAIVLPGLDRELPGAAWETLPPSHPQAGLKHLLDDLGQPLSRVRLWPGVGERSPGRARTALFREVMPASDPDRRDSAWNGVVRHGCRDLEIMELADHGTEAVALALRMRAVLEEPGATGMLVTPDRSLARRVAIELRRWNIDVDDSAGMPLRLTPQGSLLLLSAELLRGVTSPALLTLLKHPLVSCGRRHGEVRRDAERLERQALRGPRISGGLTGILTELQRLEADLARRQPERAGRHRRSILLVERVATLARPLLELGDARPAVDLVDRHLGFVEALAAAADGSITLWADEAGETAREVAQDLGASAHGHAAFPASAYPALLAQILADRQVRSRTPRHPRLQILGQLEARLQHADHVLLGGLNEGVWPAALEAGPWLNRTMRDVIGMPALERRIGQAAHDLQQLAAAPKVVLSRAERDASGNPTVPSRWLVRLKTLVERAGDFDQESWYPAWAAGLDRPDVEKGPVAQPRPTPPVHARPRELSVSDIGLWMREPYALYAKRVLRLKPLAPLEQEPGALERGIMIHDILERFVAAFPDRLPDDAWSHLHHLGREAFAAYAHRPLVRRLWWPRFEQAARWYLDMETSRRSGIQRLHAEVEGVMSIEARGGTFRLKARADRIERGFDGRLAIIDYKTGAIPKPADITGGRQPQLPLEAAMVAAGAFEDVSPAAIAGLWFWSIKGDSGGGEEKQIKDEPRDLASAAVQGLRMLIDHYDDPATAYLARLRPDMSFVRDYDHLARFKEWAG